MTAGPGYPGAGGTADPPGGYLPPSLPGIAPGPSSGIFRGRLVIVSGTGSNSGLFVYSGSPANGNPPIFWATSASSDPFGNALSSTAGVAGSGTFTAGSTTITPTVLSQQSGNFTAQLSGAELDFFFILTKIVTLSGTGGLIVGQGGANNAQVQITTSGAAGLLQFLTNIAGFGPSTIQAGPGAGITWKGIASTTAGSDDFPSLQMIADQGAGSQLLLAFNRANAGAAATYLAVTDGGAALLAGSVTAADPTHTNTVTSPAVAESWHAITLPAGLTGTARCKKLAESTLVKFDFQVTWTATGATTFTLGSLPSAAYYPAAARQVPMAGNEAVTGASSAPRIFVPTSGALQILVPASSAGGSGGNSFDLPTD